MKGLILVNAYAPATPTRQVARLRAELERRGAEIDIMRNGTYAAHIKNGNAVFDGDRRFCLYLDKDKYTSRIMEKHMRLFDSATAIELCDDKMTTHIALSDNGIPMPDTLPAPLCYTPDAELPRSATDEVISRLGLPVIVKQSFGSMGAGVFKADTAEELRALQNRFKTEPHLYQKYIASSYGKDMRVIVVGGKVLGGILRRSSTDFRSNIGLGGSAQKTDVPDCIKTAAERAAKILGLDYCGIDFLLGDVPMLCEVNSNAFFDAFEAATDINVAGAYAEHIIDCVSR